MKINKMDVLLFVTIFVLTIVTKIIQGTSFDRLHTLLILPFTFIAFGLLMFLKNVFMNNK